MAGIEGHPSFLLLDRVALGAEPGEWREHLERCQACTAYLERQQQPLVVPGWTREAVRSRRPWPWALVLASVGAAALGVLAILPRSFEPASHTTAKGTPSVAVYVKRGEAISLWDGREALAPGDRLQVEITPEGLRYVAVALRPRSGAWQPLYRGELEGTSARIPESWRLDDAPGPETLGIALSQSSLSESEMNDALERQVRDGRIWTSVLSLPKTARIEEAR